MIPHVCDLIKSTTNIIYGHTNIVCNREVVVGALRDNGQIVATQQGYQATEGAKMKRRRGINNGDTIGGVY